MWLDKEGRKFKAARGKPTYLLGHNQPFPLNPAFKSQSVLSEESREEIWQRVIVQGEALKAVSAKFGVDMRRVAAVVRLKEVEKTWEAQVSWQLLSLSPSSLPHLSIRMRGRGFYDDHLQKFD